MDETRILKLVEILVLYILSDGSNPALTANIASKLLIQGIANRLFTGVKFVINVNSVVKVADLLLDLAECRFSGVLSGEWMPVTLCGFLVEPYLHG